MTILFILVNGSHGSFLNLSHFRLLLFVLSLISSFLSLFPTHTSARLLSLDSCLSTTLTIGISSFLFSLQKFSFLLFHVDLRLIPHRWFFFCLFHFSSFPLSYRPLTIYFPFLPLFLPLLTSILSFLLFISSPIYLSFKSLLLALQVLFHLSLFLLSAFSFG